MQSFSQPLTPDLEEHYLQMYRYGTEQESKEALDILIERNLRLVAHVLKKYQNISEDMEDLISYGTIGLIKGIKSYLPGHGSKLATYVARCIDNEILMLLRSRKKQSKEVSLYEPIGTDKEGNEVKLLDVLESDGIDPTENLQKQEDLKRLQRIFAKRLTDKEQQIIAYRYGFMTGDEVTQKEVGQKMGISRSYVSRIEKRALRKLKDGFEE